MNNNTSISVKNLSVAYHKKPVLWDVNVDLPKGELIAIVGPNGAGKSSLLQSILGIIPIISGKIEILGKRYKQVQSLVSYMPQRKTVDWDYPILVQDLVAMGLHSELKWYQHINSEHQNRIMAALEQVNLVPLAKRHISQLSGGQQQRVFMARALIQNADVYLMDEPFAGIDSASEKYIFDTISMLKSQGKTIIIVHHDLNMIKRYFDYVVFLNLRVITSGKVKDVFTEENIAKTYKGRLTLLEQAVHKIVERDIQS